MLSEWNRSNSPAKQNISPQRQISPKKNIHTISKLLNLLRAHNISIPSQFQLHDPLKNTNKQISFNLIKCENQSQIKKLRVQVNDYKFELKKLQQDFAEYKVISKMDKEKIVKKLNMQIQNLKKKVQYDNNSWEKKFNELEKIFWMEKQIYQKKMHSQCEDKIKQIQNRLTHHYDAIILKLNQQIKLLECQLQQRQKDVEVEKHSIIKDLQQKRQKEIKLIKQINFQRQKQITLNLEKKIQSIEFEKKIQIVKHQQKIHKIEGEKQKQNQQIYFLNKDKQQLKQQIKNKQRKISQLQLAIRLKDQEITELQKLNGKQKHKILLLNEQKIQQVKQKHVIEIKQITKKHLNELDSYYQRILNLEQRKQKIQSQYEEKMLIMQEKFNRRVSKCQDLSEIQSLKTTLVLKDRQLLRYQEDLKRSQMQRRNNQKNYTRIFSSHTSRRKSANNTYRDKQAFFKQTNPTDLKMLLKICHKQF